MATPAEKLASSLEILYKLQGANNGVIRSRELARTHRERLVRSGYLREILKGWFLVSNPADEKGISTTWYASFWQFAAHYLNELKGDGWCLSPE